MTEKETETAGLLHQPEALRALAKQLREEAERAEARAEQLKSGQMKARCAPGCWNILSTCVWIQPL